MHIRLKECYTDNNYYYYRYMNIIIDVLGGWSCELDAALDKLLGPKSRYVLKRMQKSVMISSTLNIARTLDRYLKIRNC